MREAKEVVAGESNDVSAIFARLEDKFEKAKTRRGQVATRSSKLQKTSTVQTSSLVSRGKAKRIKPAVVAAAPTLERSAKAVAQRRISESQASTKQALDALHASTSTLLKQCSLPRDLFQELEKMEEQSVGARRRARRRRWAARRANRARKGPATMRMRRTRTGRGSGSTSRS